MCVCVRVSHCDRINRKYHISCFRKRYKPKNPIITQFEMADVDVIHTITETKKTRKVKKSSTTSSKRRESSDQGSEITITEIEQTAIDAEKGYV